MQKGIPLKLNVIVGIYVYILGYTERDRAIVVNIHLEMYSRLSEIKLFSIVLQIAWSKHSSRVISVTWVVTSGRISMTETTQGHTSTPMVHLPVTRTGRLTSQVCDHNILIVITKIFLKTIPLFTSATNVYLQFSFGFSSSLVKSAK